MRIGQIPHLRAKPGPHIADRRFSLDEFYVESLANARRQRASRLVAGLDESANQNGQRLRRDIAFQADAGNAPPDSLWRLKLEAVAPGLYEAGFQAPVDRLVNGGDDRLLVLPHQAHGVAGFRRGPSDRYSELIGPDEGECFHISQEVIFRASAACRA